MSITRPRTLTTAWLTLVVITVVSVYTAEVAPWRLIAVGAIMAIAALKGGIILSRFMDLRAATPGIRGYMIGWSIGCAIMIFAGYWYAAP